MRSPQELLELFDAATPECPLALNGHEMDVLSKSLRRRNNLPMPKGIQIAIDRTEYRSPITGQPITSKLQHVDALKRAGCRVLEPGESRDAPKRREEAFRESVSRDVDKAVDSLWNNF